MTKHVNAIRRSRLELLVIAVMLSCVASATANLIVAGIVDLLNLVQYPYLLEGLLIGMAAMFPVGLIAILTNQPLRTTAYATLAVALAYGFMAWNADRFYEVFPNTLCVSALPLLTGLIAGYGMRVLRTPWR